MNTLITLGKKMRAVVMKKVRSRDSYLSSMTTKPISTKYGYDRGMPVDRFYIERFLEQYKDSVKGVCLEIVDNSYTVKYGGSKVTTSDVLDIIPRKTTTIHGDLRNVRDIIADNTYDTLIVTQTLNVIDDYEAAISECYRILKPGGLLLVTLPTMSPAWNLKINLWRFSPESAQRVFEKYFLSSNITIAPLGNKVVTESFWTGMAVEDLKQEELEYQDEQYPLIIGIAARK
jgi:SAM-dependent methyltransferase